MVLKTGVLAQQGGTQNPTNLLFNGDFENWSAGTATTPDGWASGGGNFAREASIIKIGLYSAELHTASSNMNQRIDLTKGIAYWQGRTVTYSCWVYATNASNARLGLWDGKTYTFSSYHTGNSTWQLLQVSKTLAADATSLYVYCLTDTTDTAYFDGAMCTEGSGIFAYSDNFPEYLEGDWTATMVCGTSGTVTIDASANTGSYTKVGRKVTICGNFVVASVDSPVGSLSITGLPFVNQAGTERSGYTAVTLFCYGLAATATTQMQGYIIAEGAVIFIWHFAAGVATSNAADMQANSDVSVNVTYFTD